MIKIQRVAGRADLHHQYPGQCSAQGAHVELDLRTGVLCADTDSEIGGGVPADVWHGHRQRWSIPALRADAANELLARIAPLAERMVAGYESVWDGNNHVASLTTDDARAAADEIARLCGSAGYDDDSQVRVWDAHDWFATLGGRAAQARELGITAATTDAELAAIEEREEQRALLDGDCDGITGLAKHLAWLRDMGGE